MLPAELLKALKKKATITPISEDESLYPKFYISTGNYAVNKIISGSVFKGIPNNRITTFYGESGCVPLSAKICVLTKIDVETAEVLKYVSDIDPYDKIFDNSSCADMINLLEAIGYTQSELCKRTGLCRQTFYFNLRESRTGHTKGSGTVTQRLRKLLKKNIFEMNIQDVRLLYYKNVKFLVLTPYGFRRCSNIIDRGEKNSYIITVEDCETTAISNDHLIQLDDGSFDFAENLFNEFTRKLKANEQRQDIMIRTIHGAKKLMNIREGGVLRMCDIEIQDEHHSFYADGIAGHNSGKSLIVSNIVLNAIKENNFENVFYIDTEGGMLPDIFSSELTEEQQEKILHVPIGNIEDCTSFLTTLYDGLVKQVKENEKTGKTENNPKVMVVIDSFSALWPKAFAEKAIAGNVAGDMGQKAKGLKAMISPLMVPVTITGCPLVSINHSYKRMDAMGPQKFDGMSGGEGIRYAAHIVVQSKAVAKRQEDPNLGLKAGDSYYKEKWIRYCTVKDRLVKDGLEATMIVNYNEGIKKYAGLWDDAIRLGFIKQQGAWYTVPSYADPTKKFRKAEIEESDEIWSTFINDMDDVFQKETRYGTANSTTVVSQSNTKCSDNEIEEDL